MLERLSAVDVGTCVVVGRWAGGRYLGRALWCRRKILRGTLSQSISNRNGGISSAVSHRAYSDHQGVARLNGGHVTGDLEIFDVSLLYLCLSIVSLSLLYLSLYYISLSIISISSLLSPISSLLSNPSPVHPPLTIYRRSPPTHAVPVKVSPTYLPSISPSPSPSPSPMID